MFQANQYFDVYGFSDECLTLVAFYLESDARDWFQWMYKNHQLIAWEHFTRALVTRFGAKTLEAPKGVLAKLQMTSFIRKYFSQLEKIANQALGMAPHQLMHIFISELRYAIKFEVLAFRSIDLNDAIGLAYLQKIYWTQISPFPELLPIIQALNFLVIPISPSFSTTSSMLISSSSSHGPSASVPGVGCVPYKKLTPAKMQQKREFNLCYNCDDKWHKNHHCSFTPQL